MENQLGRNFVLGKVLVLWSMQPNVELLTKRGALGYSADPQGTIDLVAAIDSAFKVVETSNPECIGETSRWRSQKAWVGLVNKGIERLSADDVDAAEGLARRAVALNPYAPYGYVVLANAMQKRQKASEAFTLYRKAVEVSGRDTSYDEIRRQSLTYLGSLALDSAENASDSTAKKAYLETARTAYQQVMNDKAAGDAAASARGGLCRVAIASGDTGSLRRTYQGVLTNPSTFAYSDLMSAGVCMARAEMVPEATTLFQAAYEKNPYHRDALSNLSIMLLRADKHDVALPLAERLVTVEPNNPENLQLLVLSYAGIAKRARDARLASTPKSSPATKTGKKATKAPAPSGPKLSLAAIDSLFKVEKAFTDSAVTVNSKKDSLDYKVQLSDFSTSAEKATVAGTVTNLKQAASADSITVHVDFLDAAGKLVQSKDVKVAPLQPSRSGRFAAVATPGTSIRAFRYTIRK
jgi:tetratricopeptide (TPR) repeat protein